MAFNIEDGFDANDDTPIYDPDPQELETFMVSMVNGALGRDLNPNQVQRVAALMANTFLAGQAYESANHRIIIELPEEVLIETFLNVITTGPEEEPE